MKRLNQTEKDYIISLLKEGKSLNYISKITGKNKSTLYPYYKKLFGKKFKDVIIDENDDLFIGELVGLFVGDGYSFYDNKAKSYAVNLYFNHLERSYVDNLIELLTIKFQKKPQVYYSSDLINIKYHSKKLYYFLLKYVKWNVNIPVYKKKSRTVYLADLIYSYDFKRGFLKGFLDSDGHLSPKKLTYDSSSSRIIEQTNNFLISLNFEKRKIGISKSKIIGRADMKRLSFKKHEREKFFELINPRNTVMLNRH